MNLITYRGMPLRVIHSNPWVREVVLDESKSTYLWTKWIISVIVSFNPATLSATPFGNNRTLIPPMVDDPTRDDFTDKMPGATDTAIRRFLEYPRGRLAIYSVGLDNAPSRPVVVLESPTRDPTTKIYYDRDANNGPFCKVNSIQEIAGERLWQMHLVFETYIYEDSLGATSSPPILVSNRWRVSHDTNWQHLSTRVIEGIAHFRADLLAANTLATPGLTATSAGYTNADAFRNIFASFTVPIGWQRTQVQVNVLPSGNQVHYRVVDEEQMFQQQKANVIPMPVFMEYDEASWVWRGSAARAASQAGIGFGDLGAIGGAAVGTVLLPGLGPVLIGGAYASIGMRALPAISANLPRRYKTCTVRAWGNRRTFRQTLVLRALALLYSRLGVSSVFALATTEMIVRYSSSQNMAELQQTVSWNWSENGGLLNPVNDLALVAALLGNNNNNNVGDLTLTSFMAQLALDAELSQFPDQVQMRFPNDFGTRGTAGTGPQTVSINSQLGFLVTQALETIGQAPQAVP